MLGDMVALTRPMITLYKNHPWACLSRLGHKEFKPSRQLLIWNQSLQGNSWKAVSSQVCWSVLGRSTHQDCPGLCFRGHQSPGQMRARGTWPENKALRPREVQLMLRGSRCWGSSGCKCWCSWRHSGDLFLLLPGRTRPQGDVLHYLHVRITLSRKKCVYSLENFSEYWLLSLLSLRLAPIYTKYFDHTDKSNKNPKGKIVFTFLRYMFSYIFLSFIFFSWGQGVGVSC